MGRRGARLCRQPPQITIAPWADSVEPDASFPDRHAGDGRPAFRAIAHVRVRAQPRRRARHRRQQADRHDAVGAVRADRDSARRSRRCARRRCISAARCRSTAASCCTGRSATGSRRCAINDDARADDVEGRARGGRPRRRPEGHVRLARLCRLVRRASSSRSSRRTRGSPSRPIPTSLFELPAEARLPAAVRLLGIDYLAAVRRRRARVTRACATKPDATVLAFDFGTRRIGVASGNTLTRTAHPLTTDRRVARIDRASTRSRALIAEWQPARLVVGLPVHADGTPHAMTRARAPLRAAQLERALRAAGGARRRALHERGRATSRCGPRVAAGAQRRARARRGRRADHPAGMVRRRA